MSLGALVRISLVAVSTALIFSPVTAAEPSRKVVTTQNGDYFGFDLRTEQNVSLEQCGEICVGDASARPLPTIKGEMVLPQIGFQSAERLPGAVAGKIVEVATEARYRRAAAPVIRH